jgi:hypothetical protein
LVQQQLDALRSAIGWALDRRRPAWCRAVAAVEASGGRYRLEDLEEQRARLSRGLDEQLEMLLDAMLAEAGSPAHPHELEKPPEAIWYALLCLSSGIFATATANDLLTGFMATLPSIVPGTGPLYLAPLPDGWGVTASA